MVGRFVKRDVLVRRILPALLFVAASTSVMLALLGTSEISDPGQAQDLLDDLMDEAVWIVIESHPGMKEDVGPVFLVGENKARFREMVRVSIATQPVTRPVGVVANGIINSSQFHQLQIYLSAVDDSDLTLVVIKHQARLYSAISKTSYQQFLEFFARVEQQQSSAAEGRPDMEP
jgi:hypothetical protein